MLIRLATSKDAADLSRIEKSASELFRSDSGLAWLADSPVVAQAEHERLILQQTVWVAEGGPGNLVGFLNAEVLQHRLHVWELSVDMAWQRRGIGKRLVLSAYRYAAEMGLAALTLTTFNDVPWNAPAYSKIGFQQVVQPRGHLQDALAAEAAHGLPMDRRVAMRLPIGMLDAGTGRC